MRGMGSVRERAGAGHQPLPSFPSLPSFPASETKSPAEAGLSRHRDGCHLADGTTLTVRRFFAPLIEKSTVPSTSANRVWSRPRPTPGPGWNWVQRCRTMMLPASMAWPPYIFTPRYFGLESRPLREEPTPFLCAMAASPYFFEPESEIPVIWISV